MRTIHKRALRIANHQVVLLPRKFKILSVQIRDDQVCMWIELDDKHSCDMAVEVFICGTGTDVPAAATQFIATVQTGFYVWHIYTGDTP